LVAGEGSSWAQLGSPDISMAFCRAGVPVYVTLPLTVPANIKDELTSSVKKAGGICFLRIRDFTRELL
jgi:hypothetical protein